MQVLENVLFCHVAVHSPRKSPQWWSKRCFTFPVWDFFFIGTYAYKKKDIKYSMIKNVYETFKPYKIKGNET